MSVNSRNSLKFGCWLWWHRLLFRSKMVKSWSSVDKILWFATRNQVIYVIKNKNCARTWWWKLAYRFGIFSEFDYSFKLNLHLQVQNKWNEMILKLRQTQMKANKFMHLDTLAKHSPANSTKYSALLFDLIQELENGLQDFQTNKQYFHIIATPCSVDINILPANFQMECIELPSDIQLKEKFDQVSLQEFYKSYLPRDKYS